ncbi:uncharacterized protein LOC120067484 [Benincasa hispida]|uniref:uncharacterized protein LOC120067484 n=1 Tax=Benincasa hispida TaxID=102211 RepID=UPI0019002592|nr:uncharacterized protein LOC120067484 [Benincasa hispida]
MFNVVYNEEIQLISIEKREASAYCMSIKQEFDGKPWYYDIKHYITYREYPLGASKNSKCTIRKLVMSFFMNGEVLYKRNYDMSLLRCVDASEAKRILGEVHEGICRTHANGHMMATQVLHACYYWLTMESDCIKLQKNVTNAIYMQIKYVLQFPLYMC